LKINYNAEIALINWQLSIWSLFTWLMSNLFWMKMFFKMFSKENKNLVNKNWTKKWSLFSKLLLNSPGRILNYKFVDFTKILFFYLISPFLSLFEAGLTQLPSSPLHAPYRELQSQTMLHLSLTLTLSLSLLQYICVSLKQHIVNWLTKKFVSLQGFQKSSTQTETKDFWECVFLKKRCNNSRKGDGKWVSLLDIELQYCRDSK